MKQFGRKEKQRRANPLSAAIPQILSNLGDRLDPRNRILSELVLQSRKIVVQQVEDGSWLSSAPSRQSFAFSKLKFVSNLSGNS
jgi:hypothetical protein